MSAASSEGNLQQRWLLACQDLGLLKRGDFLLKSGQRAQHYWDLRSSIGHPEFLRLSVDLLAAELERHAWQFDRVVAVPYGALGLALGLAWSLGKPALIPRAASKQHGIAGELVGPWQAGERVLLVEDVVTTGGSLLAVQRRLQTMGLQAGQAICLLLRSDSAVAGLASQGLELAPALQESELAMQRLAAEI